MKKTPRPARETVLRIVRDEAARASLDPEDVINIARGCGEAARLAMRRIVHETDCTPSALADVWGCESSTAYSFLAGTRTGRPVLAGYPQASGITLPSDEAPTIEAALACFAGIDRERGAWR